MRRFILFALAAFPMFMNTGSASAGGCGAVDDPTLPPCCLTHTLSAAEPRCIGPADTYSFKLKSISLERPDGSTHELPIGASFNAEGKQPGTSLGTALTTTPVPEGTYVAVHSAFEGNFRASGADSMRAVATETGQSVDCSRTVVDFPITASGQSIPECVGSGADAVNSICRESRSGIPVVHMREMSAGTMRLAKGDPAKSIYVGVRLRNSQLCVWDPVARTAEPKVVAVGARQPIIATTPGSGPRVNRRPAWTPVLTLPDFVKDIAIGSITLPEAIDADGDRVAYTVIAGLPDGLEVDWRTLTISGTPRKYGPVNLVLRATDQIDVTDVTLMGMVRSLTPVPFDFIDVVDLPAGYEVDSNTVVLDGLSERVPVSIVGDDAARISINGALNWVPYAEVQNGDTVQVRTVAPETEDGTTKTIAVSIGGAQDAWTVATIDRVPDAFGFQSVSDAIGHSLVSSNSVTISGLTGNAPVSVSGPGSPQVSINGGPWVTSGLIENNQSLAARLNTGGESGDLRIATVAVGGVSGVFEVLTRDVVPDGFDFVDAAMTAADEVTRSNTIVVSGINAPASVVISGDDTARLSIDGGNTWVPSAVVNNGQTLQLQGQAAHLEDGSMKIMTVSIGGVTDTWTVSTVDRVPDAFAFTNRFDVTGSTLTISEPVLISGLTGTTTASVAGTGSPEISVDDGEWTTMTDIENGQSLRVRLTTGIEDGGAVHADVSVGGINSTFTASTQDASPDAFHLVDVVDAAGSSTVVSNAVVVTGMTMPVPVAIAGDGAPELSIDGGAWTQSALIRDGQSLAARLTTGAEDGSTRSASITIGSSVDTWTVTSTDTVPNSFSFTDTTNAAAGEIYSSRSLITGLTGIAPVSLTGEASARISVAGGSPATTGAISNNQELEISIQAGPADGTRRTATVTVGGISSDFHVTSLDAVPNAVDFVDVSGAEANVVVRSATILPAGFDTPIVASVTGDTSAGLIVDGGAPVKTATVAPGQSLRLQVRSPSAADGSMTTVTVTLGSVSDTWSVSTLDNTPAAFSLVDKTGAAGGTLITSDPVRILGLDAGVGVTASVTGSGGPEISINGGPWSASGTIFVGQDLAVRLTSGAEDGSTRQAVVSVGGVLDTYSVTTRDTVPTSFDFINVANATANAVASSNLVRISGIDSPVFASVSGDATAMISINGGSWAPSGWIGPEESLQVRLTAAANQDGSSKTATVTVGGISDVWTVVTTDALADPFNFPDLVNQPVSASVTSATLPILGLSSATPISISGDATAEFSIAGGAFITTGLISSGQNLQLRVTTAGTANGAKKNVTVTVGGATETWSVSTIDTVPDPFFFTGVTGYSANALATSSNIYISGISTGTPVTVTGSGSPKIQINNGAWGTSGTIRDGEQLAVSLTSGPADGTTRSATVDVGGVQAVYSVTSRDTVPEAFTIPDVANATAGALTTSNQVTITGINSGALVSLSDPAAEFSVNGGVSWAKTGTISDNQKLSVRIAAPATANGASTSVTVTIGTISDTWTVTSADLTPDAFSFTAQTSVTGSTTVTSNSVRITGLGASAPVTVSGSGSPQVMIANSGTWVSSGTISNNDYLRVSLTAPPEDGSSRTVTVTVGSTSALFVVTSKDSTPTQFTFADVTNAASNTLVISAPITVTGIDTPVPVSLSGNASAKFSKDNGLTWATSGSVSNGDQVKLQLTTPVSVSGLTSSVNVTIGGTFDIWSVANIDTMPNAFSFTSVNSASANTNYDSNSVQITGLSTSTSVSVTGTGSPQLSIAGSSTLVTNGSISNNQSLRVQLTSGPADGTSRTATVTVGSLQATYSVTTADQTPTAFSYSNMIGTVVGTYYSSSTTISGFTGSMTVSVSGSGTPQLQIGSSTSWVTTSSITSGTTVKVRVLAGALNTTRTATVTVGDASATFSVSNYTYGWSSGTWGACSTVCGYGGTQTRTVTCSRSDGVTAPDSSCTGTKPTTSQTCAVTSGCKWYLGGGSVTVYSGASSTTYRTNVTTPSSTSVPFIETSPKTCGTAGSTAGTDPHGGSCAGPGLTNEWIYHSGTTAACGANLGYKSVNKYICQ